MKDQRTVRAPAKLNLHLGVGPVREDGFHGIASIFQAISLEDSIRLVLTDGEGIDLRCECDCEPERNTMYRAASSFLSLAATRMAGPRGLVIEADKRIPAGAGLGGGSSDAAAVLRALASMMPGAVSGGELIALAGAIGSDVPFFLHAACAAVRGRGELVEPIEARTDYALVLVVPPLHVSTKEAYESLDAARVGAHTPGMDELEDDLSAAILAYSSLGPAQWPFRNDFFACVSGRHPELRRGVEALRSHGAHFSAMTGSGSVLYGVFPNRAAAGRAAAALCREGHDAIAAFPLARLPDSV